MDHDYLRILAVGDVVGPSAADALCARLGAFRRAEKIDLCIVNGENACAGNGLNPETADRILDAGANIITTGNHVWRRRELHAWLDDGHPILRPANYPPQDPGEGYRILDVNGWRVLVMNLMGVVYTESLESPFYCADRILRHTEGQYDLSVLDFHAEATGEKGALARYLDGRVTAVFGTHTHVATADEQILPKGTGFITDIGMTGADDSILGMQPGCIIEKLTTSMPTRFLPAEGNITAHGVIFDVDPFRGTTAAVHRVVF